MRDHNVIAGPLVSAQRADRQPGARMRRQATMGPVLHCQRDPDLFFSEKPEDLRLAKALCGHCPVRTACLAGALQRGEPWGVWGGELFQSGRIIEAKRPRGRPRKASVAA
jgi:WhiB family transcriptional regulator, redox-sensing transcriptional regulator